MDYLKAYTDFLKKFLNPQKPLRIVFDASNGASGIIAKKVFSDCKLLTAHYINDTPDGNFPGHDPNPLNPGATNSLKKAVRKTRADFGIITDADADRASFIDNEGKFIDPDAISRLLIWYLKPNKVVVDSGAGWLITKLTKPEIVMTRTGHHFVATKMKEMGADFVSPKAHFVQPKAEFASERSGHYYFKDFFGLDSGLLAAIQVINAVSRLPYSLNDFVNLLPQYFRLPELRLESKGNTDKLLVKLENKYKNESLMISKIDGLRMEFPDWYFHIRPSQTEPLVRVNMEAMSEKLLEEKIKELKKCLL